MGTLASTCLCRASDQAAQCVGEMVLALPAGYMNQLLGAWSMVMQNAIDDKGVMTCQFGGDQRRSIGIDSATRWP